MNNPNTDTPKIKLDFKDSKYATGRRKTSIAKVWLKKGSGKFFVNGKNLDDYFTRSTHKMQILRPFEIINQPTDYDYPTAFGNQATPSFTLLDGDGKTIWKNRNYWANQTTLYEAMDLLESSG